MKFTETEKHQMVRLTHDFMRSTQGRSWARPLLTEIGKGEKGDFPGKLNELLDLLASVIRELYTSDKPVQSR
jgi:hypothetical protein